MSQKSSFLSAPEKVENTGRGQTDLKEFKKYMQKVCQQICKYAERMYIKIIDVENHIKKKLMTFMLIKNCTSSAFEARNMYSYCVGFCVWWSITLK